MNQPGIVLRLKQGDKTVFPELVEQSQQLVYNTALGIVQNESDAEDITQEVFVTLFEQINNFREESKLSTWLYKVTISKSLDHEKKKNRQKHGGLLSRIFTIKSEDEPAHFEHPGVLLDKKEAATVLWKAIKQLPEQQRIAFTLNKVEGLSNQEIAEVMGNSLTGIESLQTRAKGNLRKILTAYYEKK